MKTFLICILTKVQYCDNSVSIGSELPWKEIDAYYQVNAESFEQAIEKYKKYYEGGAS